LGREERHLEKKKETGTEGLTGNYQKPLARRDADLTAASVLSSRRGALRCLRSAKNPSKTLGPYASFVMRRLRLPARAASAVAAGAVTVASLTNVAYADGAYRHAPPDAMGDASAFDSDPDILERMARALREMKNSPLYKQASCSHFLPQLGRALPLLTPLVLLLVECS
jgi:hypothetical protein